jgi:hypothetical protein
MGLAPETLIEVGDLCCIFSGVSLHFILTSATNRWHTLISKCFMHGALEGQLVGQYEAGLIMLK